jgi:hypothetical protein
MPRPPIQFQDLETQYYFIYCYQQWIDMVNKSLILCYNGLNDLVTAGGDTLPSQYVPFFEFDPVGQLCIFDLDILGYDEKLTNPIEIYMNSPCYTLFNTFQVINYGYQNITNGKNVKFVVKNINNTNVINFDDYNALQMYQEGSCCTLWNPIQSIIFTTGLLPVVNENISIPKIFNSDSNLFSGGNNSNISPLLTDFIVPFSNINTYKPDIIYTSSSEYRLIDLYGNSPLSSLEVSVSWKDRFGNVHPLYLNSGCSASIKILFRRKDYNNLNLLT